MSAQNSSFFVDNLSVELQQIILSNIPDILSLRSAALSCRSLYNAFLSRDVSITTNVLLNQIDADVLPEALLSQEAQSLEHSAVNVQNFIAERLDMREVPCGTWRLRDAVSLGHMHSIVEDLTEQFIASATTMSYFGTKPATRTEIARVQCAMYRFEIFCNLFRDFTDSDPDVMVHWYWADFMEKFALWELEQMACVQVFLSEVVFLATKDIAEHEVAWGYWKVTIDWSKRHRNPYILRFVSSGLERLQQISKAETYEERHGIFHLDGRPKVRFNDCPDELHNIGRGIAWQVDTSAPITLQEEFWASTSFFDDENAVKFWRWTDTDLVTINSVREDKLLFLRACGYVMWDRARIDETRLSSLETGEVIRCTVKQNREKAVNESHRDDAIRKSWEARSRIYDEGGRGWWSAEDQSRIVWHKCDKFQGRGPQDEKCHCRLRWEKGL